MGQMAKKQKICAFFRCLQLYAKPYFFKVVLRITRYLKILLDYFAHLEACKICILVF